MSLEPPPGKGELRQKLRALLKAMPDLERKDASVNAAALLRQQSVWKKARSVLFYVPLKGEIDLSPLLDEGLRAGKVIALPRFLTESGAYDAFQIRDAADDCAPGKFGISEPAGHCVRFPPKQLDLALVPGVAFDATGHRLG